MYENEAVAKIVANTMNDYILCGRLLKCKYILEIARNDYFTVYVTTVNNVPQMTHSVKWRNDVETAARRQHFNTR